MCKYDTEQVQLFLDGVVLVDPDHVKSKNGEP